MVLRWTGYFNFLSEVFSAPFVFRVDLPCFACFCGLTSGMICIMYQYC